MNGHDDLLEALTDAVTAADPVPADARLAARSALAYLNMDVALAELVFDSSTGSPALAGVRGDEDGPRLLSFSVESDGALLGMELEVTVNGPRRRVQGQVVPPGAATVRLHTTDGREPREAHADEAGLFAFDDVPAGPVTVEVRADGALMRSGWTAI